MERYKLYFNEQYICTGYVLENEIPEKEQEYFRVMYISASTNPISFIGTHSSDIAKLDTV